MPRRLTAPDPRLADDLIRLEPLIAADASEFTAVLGDEPIQRFTMVPADAGEEFIHGWLQRYEVGWEDGSRAGFAIRDVAGNTFLGFAGIVYLDLDARQGEIGYMVAPAARGRGVSVRALSLLTRWGFDELDLERLELRIDVENAASERIAERGGYRREGILRNVHFKGGVRNDTGVWSRLRTD